MGERPQIEDVQLGDDERGLSAAIRGMPTWSRVALILALLAMLAGMVVWAMSVFGDGGGEVDFTRSVLEPNALLGDATTTAGDGATDASPLGPAIFRLGFSFVAGFAVAWALRAFLKIALLIGGIVLLAVFGLQYGGVLDIDWSGVSDRFGSVGEWLGGQFASFRAFIAGALPSAASAGAGLLAGFRRT